jgi:hypothetical protein
MALKKGQVQGAQISRNEAYLIVRRMTRNAAQRKNWIFYKAIIHIL